MKKKSVTDNFTMSHEIAPQTTKYCNVRVKINHLIFGQIEGNQHVC